MNKETCGSCAKVIHSSYGETLTIWVVAPPPLMDNDDICIQTIFLILILIFIVVKVENKLTIFFRNVIKKQLSNKRPVTFEIYPGLLRLKYFSFSSEKNVAFNCPTKNQVNS